MNDTSLCALAILVSRNPVVRVSHIQQILGGLLGIVTLSYFVFKRRKMPRLLNGSTKVLIWWMIAFVLIHNTFLCAVNIWQEILFFTYSEGCDLLILTWHCLLLRIPTVTSAIGMSAVNMLLLIDQLCSIFLRHYYPKDKAPFVISACLMLFVVGMVIVIFRNEDFWGYKPHCVGGSPQNTNILALIHASLLCSHILCTLGFVLILRHFFFLLKVNKHNFVVDEKLKIRMDIASVRFMMAGTVSSFIFIGAHLSANFLFRQLFGSNNLLAKTSWMNGFYIIQWYGVVLFMLLYNWKSFSIGHRGIIDVSEERHIHFQNLKALWS